MLARLLIPVAFASVLTGCVSATDAPVVRGGSDASHGMIIRVDGEATARTTAFTLDGSYDVHWNWRGGGPHHCRPGDCEFTVTLMTTGRDFLSSVTVVDRNAPGSGVNPGWQRGKYYLYLYAPEGGYWTAEIHDT